MNQQSCIHWLYLFGVFILTGLVHLCATLTRTNTSKKWAAFRLACNRDEIDPKVWEIYNREPHQITYHIDRDKKNGQQLHGFCIVFSLVYREKKTPITMTKVCYVIQQLWWNNRKNSFCRVRPDFIFVFLHQR